MAHEKNTRARNLDSPAARPGGAESDVETLATIPAAPIAKRGFEFDIDETPPVEKTDEEQTEEDPLAEEVAEEEATLDEEDINPFGDKWEE